LAKKSGTNPKLWQKNEWQKDEPERRGFWLKDDLAEK
jgi:hypothetical protein